MQPWSSQADGAEDLAPRQERSPPGSIYRPSPLLAAMEVLTCVKNTFVEFADTESPQFEHRRSRSFGCQRDLQFRNVQNSTNPTSHAALDDIGLHEKAAMSKKKNSESMNNVIQGMLKPGTGTTAVAQLAASLPKGYSLTLTHHGKQDTSNSKCSQASEPEESKTTPSNELTPCDAISACQEPAQVCGATPTPLQSPIWSPAPTHVLSSTPAAHWQSPQWHSPPAYASPVQAAHHGSSDPWPHNPPGGLPWNQIPSCAASPLPPAYGPSPVNSAVAAAAGVASMASLAMAFRRSMAWPAAPETAPDGQPHTPQAYQAWQAAQAAQAAQALQAANAAQAAQAAHAAAARAAHAVQAAHAFHAAQAMQAPCAHCPYPYPYPLDWWPNAHEQAPSDPCASPESSTTASTDQPAHDHQDEEEPSPEEEPEWAGLEWAEPEWAEPWQEQSQKSSRKQTQTTNPRKPRMQREAPRAPARRWCCFKIKMHQDRTFHPVRMMIGKGGDNTRRIALQTGAKVRIRGRGSGHIEPATGEEAPTPLMMVVSSDFDNTDGYFAALDMSLELLQEVESAYKDHCAAAGVRAISPAFVIGSTCEFTMSQLDRASCPASMPSGPQCCVVDRQHSGCDLCCPGSLFSTEGTLLFGHEEVPLRTAGPAHGIPKL